jgi:hypothetical protein
MCLGQPFTLEWAQREHSVHISKTHRCRPQYFVGGTSLMDSDFGKSAGFPIYFSELGLERGALYRFIRAQVKP